MVERPSFIKSLMKTALAFPLVAGGILIGTKLIGEISK
jgi:hypothetical protein